MLACWICKRFLRSIDDAQKLKLNDRHIGIARSILRHNSEYRRTIMIREAVRPLPHYNLDDPDFFIKNADEIFICAICHYTIKALATI